MGKTYFISDTHFSHKNILNYEPIRVDKLSEFLAIRDKVLNEPEYKKVINDALASNDMERIKPFLEAHDEMLIEYWNHKVHDNDTVWFLGDLGFGSKAHIKEIVSKLNGHKKMIMGNHDKYSLSYYYDLGFEFVLPRKIDGTTPHLILKDYFILSHEPPAYIQPNSVYFYIYGHVHSSECYQTHTDHSQCVCVERQNFEPIEISEFDECGSEVIEDEY